MSKLFILLVVFFVVALSVPAFAGAEHIVDLGNGYYLVICGSGLVIAYAAKSIQDAQRQHNKNTGRGNDRKKK